MISVVHSHVLCICASLQGWTRRTQRADSGKAVDGRVNAWRPKRVSALPLFGGSRTAVTLGSST